METSPPVGRRTRQTRANQCRKDAGFSLIEVMAGIALVTIGLFALLSELATNIKQQSFEKSQATALHLANGSLEAVRSASYASLQAGTSTTTTPVGGTSYVETRTLQVCSPTDSPNTCTSPSAGAVSTIHALVKVTWTASGHQHTVRIARSLADSSSLTVGGTTNPLGSCGGSGTTLVSGHLSMNPSSVTVSGAGHPSSAVTVTLAETGLSNASCVPLTWSDDTGSHQVSMTGTGGTFSATIPASSITKSVSSSGGSIAFTATVPGTQAVPSAALTIVGAPAFSGNCSVSVAGLGLNIISLTPLTRNSLLPAGLSCTTVNLSKTDTVTATYQSGTGTRTATLTSTNGTTWTATIPSGTAMAKTGSTEGFTFQLTRASDSATASQSLTATLV
ncbi:MAG TPA: type II secretion system protein [Mycobacteriales bacterium]|nr:type II secretion system protein [Mycobacteriales bacterium]